MPEDWGQCGTDQNHLGMVIRPLALNGYAIREILLSVRKSEGKCFILGDSDHDFGVCIEMEAFFNTILFIIDDPSIFQ